MNENSEAMHTEYWLPPQEVVDIIDAPDTPLVKFSPDGQWMLIIERDSMPDIELVSRRMLKLAGLRIDPQGDCDFQTLFAKGVSLRASDSQEAIQIPLDDGARLASFSWSQDSKRFIYLVVTDNGQQLWMVDVDRPTAPKLLTDRLTTVIGAATWTPDGQHVICRLVPEDRGAEPVAASKPLGPNVQESIGNTSPTRTYQDLLANPDDEAMLEHYATGQVAKLGIDGSITRLGTPGIFMSLYISPDGKHLLVTRIQRPFSYLRTLRGFPKQIEVWSTESGEREHVVATLPADENIPIEGVRIGPRAVEWNFAKPATLVWTEALDGGDPNREVPFRDRYVSHRFPFAGEPIELLKTEYRGWGLNYFADSEQVTVAEYDRDRRWTRTILYDLGSANSKPITLVDRSERDRYAHPGNLVIYQNEKKHGLIRRDGDWIYRFGPGASDDGDRPFVSRQNLKSGETEQLWRCTEGEFESPLKVVKSGLQEKPTVITYSENFDTPGNFFLRNLETESIERLTDFADPTPQIRDIKKELVTYKRADGVTLSATLYLPADYREGQRLPLLIWAYPQEFNDAGTASQISGSPFRFTRMRGSTHLMLLTQGYAIMDSATMPVIGDPETMNDTFIEQIVTSAEAAIDKAVEMGVADRTRVCVGGHSYGAFMTANLLAHSDLFCAGVARSGAYNRTLTPFGFQAERRSLWDAKEIYATISPFMHADKISDPLLLIHGENDNNSGTFPLQSQRMYHAIKGNGGTVRLCMLPHESHSYRARESVLHTQAETIKWLNHYVRDAQES